MEKLPRIWRYLHNWLYWRLIANFKFFRPLNVKIKGRIKFDLASSIRIDKDSKIEIIGVLRLKKSKLNLLNSKLILSGDSLFDHSTVFAVGSKWESMENLRFSHFTVKIQQTELKLGKDIMFSKHPNYQAYLVSQNSRVKMGDNVLIESRIECSGSVFETGDNVFLNYGTEIRCHDNINIGNNVLISYECIIFDTNTHSTHAKDRLQEIRNGYPNNTIQGESEGPHTRPIIIRENAWIGMKAALLKGSIVGRNSIVGTYCVVSGEVPDDSIAVGNPFIIKPIKAQI